MRTLRETGFRGKLNPPAVKAVLKIARYDKVFMEAPLNSLLAPINSSFSLIERLSLKSAGKMLYDANGIHKAVLIKNLLDVSDDFFRSVAKANFGILTLTPPQ